MSKVWLDRAYLVFVVIAACSEVLVLSSFFIALPYEIVPNAVATIVMAGFLNFLRVYWQLAVWGHYVPDALTLWFQVALSSAVMALLLWGLKQGWRTKAAVMVALTAPGVVLSFI